MWNRYRMESVVHNNSINAPVLAVGRPGRSQDRSQFIPE